MAVAQTTLESQVTGLSDEAFQAFCDDLGGMFGLAVQCQKQEPVNETFKDIAARFGKLAAMNTVKSEGAVKGSFQLIFDKAGLFTLAGVVVMLPEKTILQHIQIGNEKNVQGLNDAIKEVGNLLVGSWDRIFRERLPKHGHFLQSSAFIGDISQWVDQDSEQSSQDEQILVPYEMVLPPYPTFKCAAVFPKSLFDTESDDTEEELSEESEQPQVDESNGESLQKNPSGQSEDLTAEEVDRTANEDEKLEESVVAEQSKSYQIGYENETDVMVTFGKEQMSFLSIPAKEVVDTSTVWADIDDDVQSVLTKMQQANVGYVIIGKDGVAEGVVSKSDIAGALSPYLKSMFSKWRRPLDDATLRIKMKWIMSRPVYAVNLNTPLLSIIEQICSSGRRCVPVLNEQGKIEGIVTVYDILRFFAKKHAGRVSTGRSSQAPALV